MEDIKPIVRTRSEVKELAPKLCVDCKGKVEYWDETSDELVFQCVNCKRFYSIPYIWDPNNPIFYFSH
ncbi:hypothetical protein LCGC14_1710090 [marine sediment metagenome]|uniref:Uncharacterized protein n=1 Tax=marine sediment metagenome TaxID=412755 RepID=A0A0F9KFK3_9ZZZZ